MELLCDRDHVLKDLHVRFGTPEPRHLTPDIQGMARIVVDQVVSVAAGAALWKRLAVATASQATPMTGNALKALGHNGLRACGLSGGKCRTLLSLADAEAEGLLNFAELDRLNDDEARNRLCSLHGIGPWSAEVFLMFGLGRTDIWPAGDLALRVAIERFYGLGERPSISRTRAFSVAWKPYRTAAALLLWKAYSGVKTASDNCKKPQ